MIISIDTTAILLIILIPTAILFLGSIALSIGGIFGDYYKSYAVERIVKENDKLMQENYELREKLGFEKPWFNPFFRRFWL